MDKKEIYEHLAKIYLDASLKKTKKSKDYPIFKNLFFFSLTCIFALLIVILPSVQRKTHLSSETALVLYPDIAKINFNFDPAKKEIFSLNLNKLNLLKYAKLGFSVKKNNYKDTTSLRIELSNGFKEKAEVYVKNIPNKWHDYKIDFSQFKNISDWSEMANLSFIIEEWNTKEDHGVVYIENIRVIK